MNEKLKLTIFCVFVPLIVLAGIVLFTDRAYAFISLCVAVAALVPMFYRFEKNRHPAARVVLLSVMTALSVAGRFVFAWLPHFKPVTAIVIICGIYLGYECGFICGAFSALISNFYFGQGPWTPFQMLAWGLIGLVAGLLANKFEKSLMLLVGFGFISGGFYSVILDIWTTLWWDGSFNATRFWANILSALPVTAIYCVSNVVFLLILARPLGKKIKRVCKKYDI